MFFAVLRKLVIEGSSDAVGGHYQTVGERLKCMGIVRRLKGIFTSHLVHLPLFLLLSE